MKRILFAFFTLCLTGCAAMMGLDNDPTKIAAAPVLNVGDTWVYRVSDGYRNPNLWEETRTVTAANADAIHLHLIRHGERITADHAERDVILTPDFGVRQGALLLWDTRRFDPPWQRLRFPLQAGKSWSQRLNADKNDDAENRRWGSPAVATRVLGWEKITVPAGTFDALRIDQKLVLDDDNYWRHATRGSYSLWYAPAVNAVVKSEKYAAYIMRSDGKDAIEIPLIHATTELLRFSRGS
jgi:hypothetical protein